MHYWENKNVLLRSVEDDDWEIFFKSVNNSDIQRYVSDIRAPMSQRACKNWAMTESVNRDINDHFFWIIENLEGSVVGMIDTHDIDVRTGNFSYGIWLYPEYEGNHYAKNSIELVLSFYFMELGYQKANVGIAAYNDRSVRLHERLGFKKEGCIRNAIFSSGHHYDELRYGILRSEYVDDRG